MSILNLQVNLGANDTVSWQDYSTEWSNSINTQVIGLNSDGGWYRSWNTFRFTSVLIPVGSVIDSAIFKFYCTGENAGYSPASLIYFEAADSPAAPISNTDLNGRSVGSSVGWTPGGGISQWFSSPELKTILQAIINRAGWASGNALQIHWRNNCSDYYYKVMASYETNTSLAAKLDITFTPPAGTANFFLFFP